MQVTLAAARVNAGLTQEAVSKLMHINKATIGNWEKGKSYPNACQLSKLLEIYGCTMDDIFFK